MRVVYVAGALSAPTLRRLLDNIHAAELAGMAIARLGAMPLVPHSMTRNMGDAAPEAFWYEGTRELLRRCDAVFIVNPNDLDTSAGTRGEVDLAVAIGRPIFIDVASLGDWLDAIEHPPAPGIRKA